jgi:hypothetical protein
MLKPPDKVLRAATDEQVRDALNIIKPTADRRDACRRSIQWEFGFVHSPWIPPPKTASQSRKEFLKLLKVVREMETVAPTSDFRGLDFHWPEDWPSREQIEKQRKHLEWWAKVVAVPQRSGPQRDPVQVRAVRAAYRLLRAYSAKYRDEKPGVTHHGDWQRLALVLYDETGADLYKVMHAEAPGLRRHG